MSLSSALGSPPGEPEPPAGSRRRRPSTDCDSDGSEVLSVGHEPPPRLSRTPSPATSAASPPAYSQPASSPASSSAAASSPGRAEFAPDASLPRFSAGQQPLLEFAPRLHELSYPFRAAFSLSPPSALDSMALLHPAACREAPLGLPLSQPPPQQHRLSVNKILQRESPEPPPPQPPPRDELQQHRLQEQQLLLNGRCGSATNGHRGGPQQGSAQLQASLKFSIDNILKADFGRRITDPISMRRSRPKKPAARPIDLSKDFAESSSEGSERGSESSTRNVSPSLPASSPAPNSTPTSSSDGGKVMQWPAWVYCTRYSDRPSSGPRTKRPKRPNHIPLTAPEEKRPRTAFSAEQLARLKREFAENKYLTEQRRQTLSKELGLNEAQIKIWFQNKRAKIKKASGQKNPLALQLMAQGLYNHSTVPLSKAEMEQAAELQAK